MLQFILAENNAKNMKKQNARAEVLKFIDHPSELMGKPPHNEEIFCQGLLQHKRIIRATSRENLSLGFATRPACSADETS